MIENKIKKLLKEKIEDSKVFIQDMTGSDNHFNLIIISSKFEGLALIEQHKVVYKALDKMITTDIHALQLKTMTWRQWKKEN